jgi:UDP-N-acetylmuramoylalanine--D-glutamate ligase
MGFVYNNVLIYGYGKSGKSVEDILKKLNVKYKIYDDNYKKKVGDGGCFLKKIRKKQLFDFDLIVISPGVSIYNKNILLAKKNGIKIVGELEFAFWFLDKPIVAITGTNGKTTTTRLVGDILNNNYKCECFGNIGNPLCCAIGFDCDYLVCEVSSFQLESVDKFKPNVSVILNIDEDHIDRHKTLQNYIDCKFNLVKNSDKDSLIVLNADDENIMREEKNIIAKKYYISKFKQVSDVYIVGDSIYSNLSGQEKFVCTILDCGDLCGVIEDVLASILVGLLLSISIDKILDSIKSFKVSKHRFEIVENKNNITFIDDSKATNIHSVLNALSNLEKNIILLLGGEDKDLKFDKIFELYENKIVYIVAFGKARNKILKVARKYSFKNIRSFRKFVFAVNFACGIAKVGDSVLLSPGCASFDEFTSYAERGDVFRKIVKEYEYGKK